MTAQLLRLAALDTKFMSKVILICNTDSAPAAHTEALRMSRFAKMVVRFNNSFPAGKSPPKIEDDIFEKEKEDYVFCLQQAADYKPQYVIILEDDAYPMENFFSAIHHLLHWKILRKGLGREIQEENDFVDDWIFVKLYYPEKWRGYSSTPSHVLETGRLCLSWVDSL